MNLVEKMQKRELWEYIQKNDPVLAELLTDCQKAFGKVELTEYRETTKGAFE